MPPVPSWRTSDLVNFEYTVDREVSLAGGARTSRNLTVKVPVVSLEIGGATAFGNIATDFEWMMIKIADPWYA
jgi:hypothetical protein